MVTSTTSEFRWRRWAAALCVLLIAFAVCAQAMHTHAQGDTSAATCLACISAHTGAPVSPAVSFVALVAISLALAAPEFLSPTSESVLPFFIRPPPSR